jgi:hypothetical protein
MKILYCFIGGVLLAACAKAPLPDAMVLQSGPTGTVWELPVEQVKDKQIEPTPGKDVDDVIAVITIPPSDKPTIVKVYEKQKSITKKAREAITGTSGNPDYSVTSNNQAVKAETTKETGLWPYLAGLGALLGGIILAWSWLKRFAWVGKLFSFFKWF